MLSYMDKKYDKTKEYYNAACERYVMNSGIVLHANIDLFLKHLDKKDTILDIGCGPGHDVQYMIDQGYNVIGVDFSEKMIAYAKKNRLGSFYCMNACDDNLFTNVGNVTNVWLSAMIMHLSHNDQKSLFQKIHANIDNGVIGIVAPLELSKEKKNDDIPFYIYTKDELYKLLDDTNFVPIKFSIFKFHNVQWCVIIAKQKNKL